MNTASKTRMTEGSISQKIIFFAIPLLLGNLFQQLYNTADSLIVGNFLGSNALAAVSSSSNLIFLMVGFINGIAMGAGVVIARYYGAKNSDNLHKAIHTTVAFGFVAGSVLTVVGMYFAPKILVLMGTPAEVLPESVAYFRTYFAGSLGVVMYNIFVGILQSVGDSRHPLIYLICSSCINVVLDIFFIAGLGKGVGSAALATAISQFTSAILCMIHLIRTKEEYQLQVGKIRFDGININKIHKKDLRRSLGIVLQDTHLFTGTVMDNIRYGKLDATDDEVIAAAKLANAHSFIKRLPDGYRTMITGDGANLSQGQRQLLAIARAAVANPPALILDEATSSIDTRTEKLVQEGMDRLMKGRTTFVIAHRLSTVRNSDCIMVLEQGRIIERGTHDELLERKGKYYQLYTGKAV